MNATSERKCTADIFCICVAAPRNISMFFNEHAAAREKILTTASERKKCFLELCILKKYFEVKKRLK